MPSVEVQIDGERGAVSVEEFLRVLGHANQILRGVDAVVSSEPSGSARWYIADLRMGSVVARLSPEARPGRTLALVDEIADAAIGGLDEVEKRVSVPAAFTPLTLGKVRQLSKSLTKRAPTFRARVLGPDDEPRIQAVVTAQAALNVDAALEVRTRPAGSLLGRLEKISVHGRASFSIYTPRTHRAVECVFGGLEQELMDQVKSALGRRVLAAGIISRNRLGQPVSVLVTSLEVLPDDPSRLSELAGLVPDLTNGLDSVDYVRSLREG